MTSHHIFAPPRLLSSLSGLLLLTVAAFPISCTSDESNGAQQEAAGGGTAGAGGVGSGGAGAGGSETLEQIPDTQGLIVLRVDNSQPAQPRLYGGIIFTPSNDGTTYSLNVRRSNCLHWRATTSYATPDNVPNAGAVTISFNGFSESYPPIKNGTYGPIDVLLDRPVGEIGPISIQAQGATVPVFSTTISMFNNDITVIQPQLNYDSSGLGHMSTKKNESIFVEWEPFDGQFGILFSAESALETEVVSCSFSGNAGLGTVPTDFLEGLWSFGGEVHGTYYPTNSKIVHADEYEIVIDATSKYPPKFNQSDAKESTYFIVDVE